MSTVTSGPDRGQGVLLEMSIDVVRRMGVVAEEQPAGARLVVTDALLDGGGAVRVGVLGTLADCASGVHALGTLGGAVPVTADLVVHSTGVAVAPGSVVVSTSEVLTQRRSGAVFSVSIFSGSPEGPLLGSSTVTYSPLRDATVGYATEALVAPWPPDDLCRSLDDLVELRVDAEGRLEVALDDGIRNGVGALAGGFTTVLADVVAERAGTAALGRPGVVSDLVVHFLAAGRAGPIGVRTEVHPAHGSGVSVRVQLIDRGAGDRLVVSGTASVRPR